MHRITVFVVYVCMFVLKIRKRRKLGRKKKRVQIAGGFCPFHLHMAAQYYANIHVHMLNHAECTLVVHFLWYL